MSTDAVPSRAEAARLQALARHAILDTPPEPEFDDIVALVRTICDVPIAAISLIDAGRQWFKAKSGIDFDETPIGTSVCALAIQQAGLFIIPDLATDPRTSDMALVTSAGGIRFYAGAPLVTADGIPIGSLCAIDSAPRPQGLTSAQKIALEALGRQVVTQIELRSALRTSERALTSQNVDWQAAIADSAVLETMLRAQDQALRAGGDFGAALQALVDAARVTIPVADGLVIEVIEGDVLFQHTRSGSLAQSAMLRLPLEGSLSGVALRQHATLVSSDTLDDPRVYRSAVIALGIRSAVAVPLTRHGNPFGVLKLHSARPAAFESRHVLIAQLLAGLISASFTERAEAEALRSAAEAKAHYRHVIDSAIDSAIISTDASGVITSWSKGGETIFGWTAAEMIGQSIARIFTPEDRARGLPAAELATAEAEGRASDERWHIRHDGSRFFAHGAVTPLVGGEEKGFVKSLRDITEEHCTRQALTASRERLELATRAAGLGSFDYDPRTNMFDWDARCRELFGIPPDAPVSYDDSFIAGLHPDDRAHADAAARQALDPDGPRRFDTEYRTIGRADGILRTIKAQGLALFDGREAIRLIGTVQDISRDREAQALLRETGERLRLAARATNDAIWDWRLDSNHVLWNEALHRAYGHDLADVDPTADWWIAHIHPEDLARIEASIHAVIDGDQAEWIDEYRFRRADGRYADVRDRGYVIRDERGVATRMIGAMLDQSDRKQVERELQRLNLALERQVEARTADRDRMWALSNDLLLRATFDGEMIAVNPAWQRLLGWAEAELIGLSFFDLCHPDDVTATARASSVLEGGGSIGRFDNRFRRKDGQFQWISWTAQPGDGLINAAGRDFSAEKAQAEALALAEEQLRQSQKMEAVGQLTGGLAHDFNNLLAGISGSIEMMQIRIAQGRIGELDRYLVAMQAASARAAALTHRLLAFSRRQTLSPSSVDANRLVADMEDLIRRTVGASIEVESRPAQGLWRTLVDPHQLENALLNLCINARDAMPDGGRLTIETANLKLDEHAAAAHDLAPGQYIRLCVTDTGTGMSKDVAARAFDPFYTTKPIGKGTGLGLSMIYGFARQSEGQARIYSEPGHGARICLYLPHHIGEEDGPAEVSASDTTAPRAIDGETVLVVDDEATVRMLVVDALAELGYTALEAEDAAGGLKIVRAGGRIDLLVTDVGLPGGMNGRQLAEAAQIERPGLKILFITGYAENAVLGSGQLGPDMQVLTKPFAMDALGDRIRSMIEGTP